MSISMGPPCSLGGDEVFRCSFLLNKVMTMVLEESSTCVSCLHKQIPFVPRCP